MQRNTAWIRPSFFYRLMQAICRPGTTLLFDLKTYGIENVPASGPVLMAANHQSYLDPVLLGVHLRRPVSFLSKSELFTNRYFGGFITRLHAYPVKQGSADVGAIKETVRRLHEGSILNIFPEGTRTETGELQPLERGIALIIRRADVPVVPVAIHGSFEAWPKDKSIFHSHPIRMIYGKPMNLSHLKGDEIIQTLHDAMQSLLTQLKQMPIG